MAKTRVLVVEDDPDGRKSVVDAIEDIGFEVEAAVDGEEGIALFQDGSYDVVLSDLVLPGLDGIAVMEQVLTINSTVPFLIMTAHGTVSTAVKALKSGAYDYVTKPLDLDDIQSKIIRAAETGRLRGQVQELQESVKSRYSADAMVAEDDKMKELVRDVKTLAQTDATVLVQGESGSGKELVARALHYDGKRKGGPFVAVNCGAFAETLLESELFGHEKGAFTGAVSRRKGAFERADGGTLFLDEVGTAPLSVQVKLLRVLEERELVRVGGHESFSVDVRVVSAANRDLAELVEAGEFREDLLYRLKVVSLTVPPLRERMADIRPLTERFAGAAAREYGRTITGITDQAYEKLESYEWPGNIRELRNVIDSSVIMLADSTLDAENLKLDGVSSCSGRSFEVPAGMTMDEIEKEVLLQVLDRCKGNKSIAAEKLGVSRRTIQRKVKEYDLPY